MSRLLAERLPFLLPPRWHRPQQAQPGCAGATVFTLDQAIQYAADHYPTVRAALEQVNASAAGVSVPRTAYLPRLDSFWQSNRATANNIFGQLLPQSVMPALSGPGAAVRSGESVWGSAAGALFSWEPLDFGLRERQRWPAPRPRGARAGRRSADAARGAERRRSGIPDGARRAEQRSRPLRPTRPTRCAAPRPCMSLSTISCAPAPKPRAPTRSAPPRRRESFRPGRRSTSPRPRWHGCSGSRRRRQHRRRRLCWTGCPSPTWTPAPPPTHPLAQVRQAAVDLARAQEMFWRTTDFPRVYLQSSVFARGSGANPNGHIRRRRRRPGARSRQLGRRSAGGVPESVRFLQSARTQGRRGSVRARGESRSTTKRC